MKNSVVIIFLILLTTSAARAAEAPLTFDKNDRVLVFAAHPDDETLGAAGAMQKAIAAGAAVKVALFTNGDNNEPAFIVYEKRLTFLRSEFLHMGEVRRQESVSAMRYLGLGDKDIVFLGYPDFGTLEIFTKYWGKTKPFRSFFTRSSKVPYPECLSPGAPYVGESALKDIKKVITDFKPTKIFVSNPADKNRDHRALYLFLKVALWDLEGKIKRPEIYPYLVHLVGWPMPRGYHPELKLAPPDSMSGIPWISLPLAEKEIDKKRAAVACYKSEIEYDPPYLFTYVRANELYGDYPPIKSKESSNIYITLNLKRKADKDAGMTVFLLGYSKKTDFAAMPKLWVSVDAFGIHIKDKRKTVSIKDAAVSYEGNAVILKMPLAALGNPDYVFTSMRAAGFSEEQTAWRIMELNGG